MDKKLQRLENVLRAFYQRKAPDARLVEGILYSIEAGGKRIRPLLFLDLLEGFGVSLEQAHFQVAAALEMIHTGSLIHDDLPAMDNDDYRRGRLTNHKVFGEAAAILAGDSLFLDAFALLAEADLPAEVLVRLSGRLSWAAGTYGMVGGQALDMEAEGEAIDLEELQTIHVNKTGRLLHYPFWAAACILGLEGSLKQKLEAIGQRLGLAFQVRDDILDVTATFQELGKTPQKDVVAHKATYPALLGLEASQAFLQELLDKMLEDLVELEARGFEGQTLRKRIEGLAIGK